MRVFERIGENIRKRDVAFAQKRARNHIHRAIHILNGKEEEIVAFITRTVIDKELENHGRLIKSGQTRTRTAPQCDAGVVSGRAGPLESSDQEIAEAGEYPERGNQGSYIGDGRRDRGGGMDGHDLTDVASQIEHLINQGEYARGVGNGAYERDRHDSNSHQEERGVVNSNPEPIVTQQTFLCQQCYIGYTHYPEFPCLECQEKQSRKPNPTQLYGDAKW